MRSVDAVSVDVKGSRKMDNVLTFDVEDWFQVAALRNVIRYEDWDKCESRIMVNTVRILEPLSRKETKATFFILGWIAERFPQVVRMIYEAGHEVATHGYFHKSISEQSRHEFEQDLTDSIQAIERIIPERVRGYRAPNFSVSPETFWVFEVLAEHGIEYDSSIFPIKHDRYGVKDFPRFPVCIRIDGYKKVVEFPVSTLSLFGRNIPVSGGGYFRLYPYHFIKWAINNINSSGRPVLIFLHPWELDPDLPRARVGFLSKFRTYTNLYLAQERFSRLLNDFEFSSMREVLATRGPLPEVFAVHF